MLKAVEAVADPPAEGEQKMSEAGREDARFEAQASGGDVAGIEDEIAFQKEVNRVVDPIILAHEGIFSEAGFNGDGTAYVAFAGQISEEDAEVIARLPKVELIENAALSAGDADALMVEISTVTADALPEEVSSLVHVSPRDGASVVATPEALPAAAQDEVRGMLVEGTSTCCAVPCGTWQRPGVRR